MLRRDDELRQPEQAEEVDQPGGRVERFGGGGGEKYINTSRVPGVCQLLGGGGLVKSVFLL